MAKKKEKEIEEQDKKSKKEETKKQNKEIKPKIEKKIVNKQKDIQPQLFSQRELADMFGVSVYQMDSMYSIRGIDRKKKLSFKEAQELFEM